MASADLLVVRYIKEVTMGVTPDSGAKATGTLTGSGQPANSDTVTINGVTYTFKTALTPAAYEVKIGASLQATLLNLYNAINRAGGVPDTDYGKATPEHGTVEATSASATTVVVRSKRGGTAGNAYATTDGSVNLSWGGATLAGGTNSGSTALKQLRYITESLVHNIETTQSTEVTPDRAETDTIPVSVQGSGGANFELSYASFDDFLEAVMCGAYSGLNLDNGTTLSTFMIQKEFGGMAPTQFHDFNGVAVDGMDLNMDVGKIVTGALSFLAFGATVFEAQIGGATFPAVSTTTPMSAVANLQNISIDGVPYTGCVMSMKLRIKNNIRAIRCVGQPKPRDMKVGKFQVTGDLQFYFNEGSNYSKFTKNTEFSFSFELQDAVSNKYTFTFPRCKFETGEVAGGGINTDVMFNASFRALKDTVTGRVLRITKTS
jgi:hypothetical protein